MRKLLMIVATVVGAVTLRPLPFSSNGRQRRICLCRKTKRAPKLGNLSPQEA
jgi:hypothetical protein